MAIDVELPELGENVEFGQVARVLVQTGDRVEKGQSILELETDKAAFEVPCPQAGTVSEILVSEGDEVTVGQVVLRLESAGATDGASSARDGEGEQDGDGTRRAGAASDADEGEEGARGSEGGAARARGGAGSADGAAAPTAASGGREVGEDQPAGARSEEGEEAAEEPEEAARTESAAASDERPEDRVDVQTGEPEPEEDDEPRAPSAGRRADDEDGHGGKGGGAERPSAPRRGRDDAPSSDREQRGAARAEDRERAAAGAGPRDEGRRRGGERLAPASPSVRRLARELGLDVNQVPGQEDGGRVSAEDVKAEARRIISAAGSPMAAASSGGGAPSQPELPDFSQWGQVERQPMSKVRRLTAERMARSWVLVPQVTHHDRADVTEVEQARRRIVARRPQARLTLTAVILKLVAHVLREMPQFNASLDVARGEIVYKRYVHLGVAVDTDRGLLVPVVRDADSKSVLEIADEVDDLARRSREKKIRPDELTGSSFTITNLGGIGGSGFSPIVSWPEVAILGVSRAARVPRFGPDDVVEPRLVLPLSLSYDHRLIDGADAARFVRRIVALLEDPLELWLAG